MTDADAVMPSPPSLLDWMGGMDALRSLLSIFYERVHEDEVLGPLFAHARPDHPERVADFMGEVFGGPRRYSEERGGHASMIRRHMGRALSEAQRQRWMRLLLECADSCGVPDDPEFRSAFVAYLEWGSRLAVINSMPGVAEPDAAAMPVWGWGVVEGPYRPNG